MESKELFPAVLQKISRDFSTFRTEIEVKEEYSQDLEAIKNHLTEKIKSMLEKDFERFLSNMYRIDVSEKKVVAILNKGNSDEVPSLLADLIIERQIQRLETQRLYKEGKI